jgi:hypothetical protein
MTRTEIVDNLSLNCPTSEIGKWLRESYMPEIIRRFNLEDSRKRLGLYQGERIPENERNLTDVRNRVSLIIEYELARISNDLLSEHEISDVFWCYVVANRFPDLEIRRISGERLLRIEVKCLQSIAEEKAANFDTLTKDINPQSDFVVALIWEWVYDDGELCNWDRAPAILKAYVFHAKSLALLRDTYWLNSPPRALGDGFQGFDLRYAVNCKNGEYSKEGGNYGKILRIWQRDFRYRPRHEHKELADTENEYCKFVEDAFSFGFMRIAKTNLNALCDEEIEEIFENERAIGFKAGLYTFIS